MKLTKEEVVYCDVDNTLVFSHEGDISVDYYGELRFVRPHLEHIQFLKSLKARGCIIKVHSHNGAQWAYNVCVALGLNDIVDECLTKPYKVIDDEPIEKWTRVIYVPEPKPNYIFNSVTLPTPNGFHNINYFDGSNV